MSYAYLAVVQGILGYNKAVKMQYIRVAIIAGIVI